MWKDGKWMMKDGLWNKSAAGSPDRSGCRKASIFSGPIEKRETEDVDKD